MAGLGRTYLQRSPICPAIVVPSDSDIIKAIHVWNTLTYNPVLLLKCFEWIKKEHQSVLSLSSKKKNKVLARCLCFSVLHHYKFNHLDCEILSQYTEFNQTLISKWLTDSVSLDYCMCHYTVFLLHISCSGIIHTQSCDSLLMSPDLLINLLSLLFGIFYFKSIFFYLLGNCLQYLRLWFQKRKKSHFW